ncbi:hypothetical protein D9613_000973 [Agrocybe pediades]|uniref:Hydrophobin n=1 Tax=Agrocybe pediades TaxID=84607 RepID=A0A8H4R1D0_9AGAR|nr:hypothetical protein D9613_000973 [Agrocybe pediades]
MRGDFSEELQSFELPPFYLINTLSSNMQFTSAIALAVAASPIFAAATPVIEARDGDCNTGSTLCCNQVQASNSTSITQLAGLLGIALPSLGLLAGSPSTSSASEATPALLNPFAARKTTSAVSSLWDATPSTSTFEWIVRRLVSGDGSL